MMSNFSVEVVDAATGTILPKTTINGRIYVAAEHSKEIYVRLIVHSLSQHMKLWPEGYLNGWVEIEGKSLGYSHSVRNNNPV